MADLELGRDERVLFEAACLSRPGVMAHNGEATLTTRRLHFEPRKLDRLTGAKAFTVDLLAITSAARRGVDGILEIRAGEETHKLMGDGAKALEPEIKKAIEALEQSPAEKVGTGPAESVRLVVPAGILLAEGAEVAGEATITSRRLCFRPAGRARYDVPGPGFDLTLHKLRDVRLTGPDRLAVVAAEGRFDFSGAHVKRLFGQLAGVRPVPAREELPEAFRTFRASLLHDGRAYKGHLAMTREALVFWPDDAAAGDPPLRMPVERISFVAVPGLTADRLVVRCDAEEWTFAMDDLEARLRELSQLLAEVPEPGEPEPDSHGRLPHPVAAALVDAWRDVLGEMDAHDVSLAGPGVLLQWPEYARRGWMVVSRQAAWLLPNTGPLANEELKPLTTSDFDGAGADGGSLKFRARPDEIDFLLRPGPAGERIRDGVLMSGFGGRVVNRRASYRASPGKRFPIRVSPLPAPEAPPVKWLGARLSDVSAEGCQIVSDKQIGACAGVALEIPCAKDVTIVLRGRIVNSTPGRGLVPVWHYGLRLDKAAQREDRLWRELWMRFQREETARHRMR